jgi:hypothetical protein
MRDRRNAVKIQELPTNEDFSTDSWGYVLNVPTQTDWESGPYVSTTAKEVLTQADRGEITLDRIEAVDAFHAESPEGYASTNVFALVRLTDGWATLVAWCDTTGWDCQSGGDWRWAATREQAVANGLGNEERAALGLSLAAGSEVRDGD